MRVEPWPAPRSHGARSLVGPERQPGARASPARRTPTGPHFVLERVRRDGPPSIAFFSASFLRREEMASARLTAIPIAIGVGVEVKLSIVSLPHVDARQQ